jgi:two-component system phosphate regulon response regulator PhoB
MAYLMIVDDDEDFANAVAIALREAGHEVDISLDPRSAVVSMEQRRPDLAILDVIFPEDISAGFALARTMQHDNDKLKDVPILMLTAVNQKFPLGFGPRDIDGDWLPVADFLEKPVDLDVLQKKVSALLDRAGSPGSEQKN